MERYSRQFKAEPIKLVTAQGFKPAEAARKLGLPDTTYQNWLDLIGGQKPQATLSEASKVLQV